VCDICVCDIVSSSGSDCSHSFLCYVHIHTHTYIHTYVFICIFFVFVFLLLLLLLLLLFINLNNCKKNVMHIHTYNAIVHSHHIKQNKKKLIRVLLVTVTVSDSISFRCRVPLAVWYIHNTVLFV